MRVVFALLLGWGGLAFAGPLDAARAHVKRTAGEEVTLLEKQAALRGELNDVSARVDTLKQQHRRSLPPSSELTRALQRSQELSVQLEDVARDLNRATAARQAAQLGLVNELNAALADTQHRWETSPSREERRSLLSSLRALRTEREQARAGLPGTELPAMADEAALERSENPADLLEQADALRDSADKVRQRLQQLDARIKEARAERDLDRRMSSFVNEDNLFDENVRRLRVSRGADGTLSVDRPGSGSGSLDSAAALPRGGTSTLNPSSGGVGAPPAPVLSAHGVDHQVAGTGLDKGAELPEDARLDALEAEQKRLLTLQGELLRRAGAAEAKAKTLQ